MKSLLIIANPNKNSFSHAMASEYKNNNPDSEILDLYELDQEFLNFVSTEELKNGESSGGEKQSLVQEKITEADELVFFFPIWWGNIPAILKNFFDVNLSNGYAFEFVKGKNFPKKLLVGKIAKIYTTCDAPSFLYKIPLLSGINLKKYLDKSILGFCGIKTTEFKIFGNLRKTTKEQRNKILENI